MSLPLYDYYLLLCVGPSAKILVKKNKQKKTKLNFVISM